MVDAKYRKMYVQVTRAEWVIQSLPVQTKYDFDVEKFYRDDATGNQVPSPNCKYFSDLVSVVSENYL